MRTRGTEPPNRAGASGGPGCRPPRFQVGASGLTLPLASLVLTIPRKRRAMLVLPSQQSNGFPV